MLGMSLDNICTLLQGAKYLLNAQPPEISKSVAEATEVLSKEIDEVIESTIYVSNIRKREDDRIGMEIGSLSLEEADSFWKTNAEYEALLVARQKNIYDKAEKPSRRYSRKS
jgi:hypothetical protein